MNALAMKLPDVHAGDLNVLALAAGAGSPGLYIIAIIAFVVVRVSRSPVASTWLTQRGETQRAQITADTERYRIDAETKQHRVDAETERRRGPDRLRAKQPPDQAVPAARRPHGQEAGQAPTTRAS